jgi:hypothetical protein
MACESEIRPRAANYREMTKWQHPAVPGNLQRHATLALFLKVNIQIHLVQYKERSKYVYVIETDA